MAQAMIKEAVGIFDNKEDLDEAIMELESTAFRRDVISVLGNKKAIEDHFGRDVPEPDKIMDDPNAPRATPVYPEEKGIGTGAVVSTGILAGTVGALVTAGAAITVPAAVTAAVIGGGSGAVVAKVIGDYYDDQVQNQIDNGGLLLWVQTPGPDREKTACAIMKKHGARKVHLHEIT
ncbi:MAG: hypothetical protein VXW91_03035 [Pseudomonadota bacterium]|nr:hypothetical protein [Pseudomonadota bacterium]MEC8665973.1 hypothetical protein [Pseudomonadota bacterium]